MADNCKNDVVSFNKRKEALDNFEGNLRLFMIKKGVDSIDLDNSIDLKSNMQDSINEYKTLLQRLSRNLNFYIISRGFDVHALCSATGISVKILNEMINQYYDHNDGMEILQSITSYLGIIVDDLFFHNFENDCNDMGLQNCETFPKSFIA